MTTIKLPDIRSSISTSEVALELWRVTGRYGFHPAKGTNENAITKDVFQRNIDAFISHHLVRKLNAPCTVRTIEHILLLGENPRIRRPVERARPIPLTLLNELAIVWACTLLRFEFRGITEGNTIDTLKSEVVWLLEKFEYSLFSKHSIFCPLLNIWENEKDWQVVRDNDLGIKGDPILEVHPSLLAEICGECLIRSKTVYS